MIFSSRKKYTSFWILTHLLYNISYKVLILILSIHSWHNYTNYNKTNENNNKDNNNEDIKKNNVNKKDNNSQDNRNQINVNNNKGNNIKNNNIFTIYNYKKSNSSEIQTLTSLLLTSTSKQPRTYTNGLFTNNTETSVASKKGRKKITNTHCFAI